MSTLYVTEYARSGIDSRSTLPAAEVPSITTQAVTIGASSTQSSAFNAQTTLVRVHTDAKCHIMFGADPTATTSLARMAADTTEYFAVKAGHKIAVIAGA